MAENLQKSVYAQLIGHVDLTSLKTDDTDESISALVEKVNAFDDKFEIIPHPAAICVYPAFVGLVKSTLTEDVEIVAVAGGFPHSQTMIEVKVAETSLCVAEGATEIDVVIPVGKVMQRDPELIKEAAVVAMVAGADFIKTSTGKDSQCASLEAVYTMCEAIAEFNKLNNTKVGLKVAGGVSTTSDAVKYYTLVKEMLGEEWLTPDLFRIGASRLVNNLLTSVSESDVKYF